jgi:hypothetical protein
MRVASLIGGCASAGYCHVGHAVRLKECGELEVQRECPPAASLAQVFRPSHCSTVWSHECGHSGCALRVHAHERMHALTGTRCAPSTEKVLERVGVEVSEQRWLAGQRAGRCSEGGMASCKGSSASSNACCCLQLGGWLADPPYGGAITPRTMAGRLVGYLHGCELSCEVAKVQP